METIRRGCKGRRPLRHGTEMILSLRLILQGRAVWGLRLWDEVKIMAHKLFPKVRTRRGEEAPQA